jgi:hypothetical protein
MRVAQLGKVLDAFANALKGSGAGETAERLQTVVRGLVAAGSVATQRFVAALDKVETPSAGEGPTLASVEAAIKGLIAVLKEVGAKKQLISDVQSLLDLFGRHREMSIAAFESAAGRSVASASQTRPDNRGATPVDPKQLVEAYLQRLESALGNEKAFPALCRELEDDPRITKTEAIEIASRFFEPMPASTTRRKAVKAILSRHQQLIDSRAASATIGA